MKKPSFSIVIPSWRKSKILARCLSSLIKQNYPKNLFEIIIISKKKILNQNKKIEAPRAKSPRNLRSGFSTCDLKPECKSAEAKNPLVSQLLFSPPKSADISRRRIKLIKISKYINHAEARNIGVSYCRKEIIAFCDDDCVLRKNWLLNASEYFAKKKVDLISGPVIPFKKTPSFPKRVASYLAGSRFAVGFAAPRYRNLIPEQEANEFDLILANTFVRKEVFKKFGGFSKNQVPCEENFLYYRLKKRGSRLLYVPKIYCFHPTESIILPWARKIFFYAQGRGAMVCRAPETFHFQYIIPSLFTISIIILALISPFSLLANSFLLATVIVYLSLNLLNSAYIFLSYEQNPLVFLLAPLATFVNHLSYGIGFLCGFVRYLSGRKLAVRMPNINQK